MVRERINRSQSGLRSRLLVINGESQLNMKKLFILTLASILFLSACGTPAEPTISAEEVQGTAVAAAMTMVAQTQAAIPTATPIPPTDTPAPTPLPTNTIPPLELPTQPLVLSSQRPLHHLMPMNAINFCLQVQLAQRRQSRSSTRPRHL